MLDRSPMLAAPALRPRHLTLRLSVMFFVELAVSAAYFPLLSLHLAARLRLSAAEISAVYVVGPIATLVGPLLVGWIADRLLPAERSLTILNVARAAAFVLAARAADFPEMLLAMAAVGLTSSPASVLAFGIAFHHLERPEQLGRTRVWGTVSWIVLLWATSAYMASRGDITAQVASTPIIFYFAAALSLVSAGYALTLPHTPPARVPATPFAFLQAFGLLRQRSFRALVLASVLSAMCMQFHFMLWPLFFTDARAGLGLDIATATRAVSLAQVPELFLFPALAFLVQRFGLRNVLFAGMLAWTVRFGAYTLGTPPELVIGAQALHGVNVVCGMMAAQVAVDQVAPSGARVSSHALLTAASGGAGNLVGQLLAGALLGAFASGSGTKQWALVFAVPLLLGVLAAAVVLVAFKPAEKEYTRPATAPNA